MDSDQQNQMESTEGYAGQRGACPGSPGLRWGLLLMLQGSTYLLTWTLVPPPGAPLPASPLETTLTQSTSLSL
jgi:hypothetical protein